MVDVSGGTCISGDDITLIRVKENTGQRWNDVADTIYYIPKVRTYSELDGLK